MITLTLYFNSLFTVSTFIKKKRFRSQSDQSKMLPSHLEPITPKNTNELPPNVRPTSNQTSNNQQVALQKPKYKVIDIDVDVDPTINDENEFIKKITIPIDSRLIKESNNLDHINLDINLRQAINFFFS
jgi:hypothetical protein